jgi:hypothetical protein
MSALDEIRQLEEALRQAELAPDPQFFEDHLADDALIDGQRLKARVVEAHRPGSGSGPKFAKVEMSEFGFAEHGPAVVVTGQGYYEGPQFTGVLKFMRVWLKENARWRIIAAATLK